MTPSGARVRAVMTEQGIAIPGSRSGRGAALRGALEPRGLACTASFRILAGRRSGRGTLDGFDTSLGCMIKGSICDWNCVGRGTRESAGALGAIRLLAPRNGSTRKYPCKTRVALSMRFHILGAVVSRHIVVLGTTRTQLSDSPYRLPARSSRAQRAARQSSSVRAGSVTAASDDLEDGGGDHADAGLGADLGQGCSDHSLSPSRPVDAIVRRIRANGADYAARERSALRMQSSSSPAVNGFCSTGPRSWLRPPGTPRLG